MARVTAQQWLQEWGQGLQGAGQRIKAGVQRVQVAPGVAAAAAENKMLANTTEAITSGRWSNRVSAIPLSQWQDSMVNKGVNNISAGVTQAQKTKVQQITKMLADNDAAMAVVANMPTDTMEQRIAKATAFMRARSDAANRG